MRIGIIRRAVNGNIPVQTSRDFGKRSLGYLNDIFQTAAVYGRTGNNTTVFAVMHQFGFILTVALGKSETMKS